MQGKLVRPPQLLSLLPWRRLFTPTAALPSPPPLQSFPLQGDPDDPPFSPLRNKPGPSKPKTKPKRKAATSETLSAKEAGGGGGGSGPVPLHSDLPFDFRYSYSETDPSLRPIGFREPPRFSPFGPGRLDRAWDGVLAPAGQALDLERAAAERAAVLGDPLTEAEVEELVERYRHSDCSRQINIGKGGVTHNLLDDIHNHWKRAEAVRIKCLGVPTLDMDNVCFHLEVSEHKTYSLQVPSRGNWFKNLVFHTQTFLKSSGVQLQDKTGGKIIYRKINNLLLYRGRNYDPEERPVVPLMLWKPRAPIYPRLVKNVAEGLTFEETKEMRNRGLNSPALMTLTRNGVYVNVVERVREAFKAEEVVRLDCSYVETSDCKKIGVKLRDLVPCVPILFKKGQIILWRGKQTFEDQCNLESLEPSLTSQVGEN